jgi:hypothetical protein
MERAAGALLLVVKTKDCHIVVVASLRIFPPDLIPFFSL